MVDPIPSETVEVLCRVAQRQPGLAMLVLFGSRARHDARPSSDWDFAYTATGGDATVDADQLLAHLNLSLGTDHVDLVNLARAGGLLRFRAARDGVVIYERVPGSFRSFWLEAVDFWCDARPILEPAYEAVLARLSR